MISILIQLLILFGMCVLFIWLAIEKNLGLVAAILFLLYLIELGSTYKPLSWISQGIKVLISKWG